MTETLNDIGLKHGTDKATYHGYTFDYDRILSPLRHTPLAFLELGWGGYDDPNAGGESARMWKDYAPEWEVVVADIYPKSPIEGVNFRQGSQDDATFLNALGEEFGGFEVIVDDASHVMAPTLASFNILWPHLHDGGWYFIEDLGTSYLSEYMGGPDGKKGTVIEYLKSLVDTVMLDTPIASLQFSKGLVAIQKADNLMTI